MWRRTGARHDRERQHRAGRECSAASSPAPAARQGAQRQGDRGPQRQEHRRDHRQDHVLHHVHATAACVVGGEPALRGDARCRARQPTNASVRPSGQWSPRAASAGRPRGTSPATATISAGQPGEGPRGEQALQGQLPGAGPRAARRGPAGRSRRRSATRSRRRGQGRRADIAEATGGSGVTTTAAKCHNDARGDSIRSGEPRARAAAPAEPAEHGLRRHHRLAGSS